MLGHYNKSHPESLSDIENLFNQSEIVKCPICSKMLGQLGHKHLAAHSISFEDFKKQFPDCKMRPDSMRKTWSDRCKRINKTKEMRNKVSKALSDGYASGRLNDVKKQVSETRKKKFASGELVAWNKGLTKEINTSLQSTSNKFRKLWSERRMNGGARIKGYFTSTKNQNDIPYRSTYELKAFQILEESNDISGYEYEAMKIRYRDRTGKLRTYYPDIVTDTKRIIEVKSDWVFQKQNPNDDDIFRKFAAAERWASKRGYTFEVWTEKELGIR
jgi:hypothetical protein